MKINCPACGHRIELSEVYDDFEGPIRCWVCHTPFEIRLQEGCVKMARECEPAPSRFPNSALPAATHHESSNER